MPKLLSCSFDSESDCVELVYSDGSVLSVYCEGVTACMKILPSSKKLVDTLIKNDPFTYAQMVIHGTLTAYLSQHSKDESEK